MIFGRRNVYAPKQSPTQGAATPHRREDSSPTTAGVPQRAVPTIRRRVSLIAQLGPLLAVLLFYFLMHYQSSKSSVSPRAIRELIANTNGTAFATTQDSASSDLQRGQQAYANHRYAEALEWSRKGAAAGNGDAMNCLGVLYERGLGVPQNYEQAMKWFQRGAAAHSLKAICNIGLLYVSGQGVPRDYTTAMKWFRKGAAAGSGDAMNCVGMLYERGFGVPQNYGDAMKWFQKGAARGSGMAMYNIGLLYANGQGVPQNYARAMVWWLKAEDSKSPRAVAEAAKVIKILRGKQKKE